MSDILLKTPIADSEIEKLNVGDIIYVSGIIATGRDDVHIRAVREGLKLPVDFHGGVLFHAGPIVRKIDDEDFGAFGGYEVISIGPTTSMRMEEYEHEFIKKTGVKLIIGKGGMGTKTVAACKKYKAVHAVFPGGCAVLAARYIEAVNRVEWLDLGMPEAMWVLKAERFGPLLITIDVNGNNLFETNKALFNKRKEAILKEISLELNFLH